MKPVTAARTLAQAAPEQVLAVVPTPGTGGLPPGLFDDGANLIAFWAMGILGLLAFFALVFVAYAFMKIKNGHESSETMGRLGFIAGGLFLGFSAGAIVSAFIALGGDGA